MALLGTRLMLSNVTGVSAQTQQPTIATDGFYEITNAEQLAWFRDYVNIANEEPYKTASARLTVDIDLSTVCGANVNGSEINWTPIAKQTPYADNSGWTGTFDGNGHRINGLHINAPNRNNQGLFGFVGGEIKNLIVQGQVKGQVSVGLLAALLGDNGIAEYCTMEGSVNALQVVGGVVGDVRSNSSRVSNCINRASVTGNNWQIGGIVGRVEGGTVSRSVNFGDIKNTRAASGGSAGGIAGQINGNVKIEDCANTGSVEYRLGSVGGIVGDFLGGSIANCFNTGTILANVDNSGAHGIAGSNYARPITNSYYLNTTTSDPLAISKTAEDFASGIIARLLNGGNGTIELPAGAWGQTLSTDNTPLPGSKAVYCLTTGETKRYGNTATELPLPKAPFTFDGTKIYGGNWTDSEDNYYTATYTFSNKDLTLTAEKLLTDMNEEENKTTINGITYYNINTAEKLAWFSAYVNTADEEPYKSASALLTANIDLSTVCGANVDGAEISWSPIAKQMPYNYNSGWTGAFDGNGKRISNLYIKGVDCLGLFGLVEGKITNLTVQGNITGSYSVGMVAGYTQGSATMEYCTAEGSISGSNNIGGLVGHIRSAEIIANCINMATVAGSSNVGSNVGGIAGQSYVTVSRSVNYGNITGAGSNASKVAVGGIIGDMPIDGIKDCMNLGTINCGQGAVGGLIGRVRSVWVLNCFNAGTIISNAENPTAHSVVGGKEDSFNPVINNCYYLDSEYALADPYATAQTAEELKSGATAWLLNGSRPASEAPWGQRIGTTGIGDLQPMLLFAESDNILKKEEDGSYTCANLVLDGNNTFYSPEDFSAQNVSLAADFTGGNYDAFILPVAIPVNQIKGSVYRLQSVNHTAKEFTVVPVNTGSIEANVPYIVKTTESGSLFDPMTNTSIQGKSSAGSLTLTVPGAEFTGIYMGRSFDPNGERRYCKLLPDGTLSPTPYNFYMGTFSAVISLAKPVSEGDYTMKIDDVGTSIATPDAEVNNVPVNVYDINGRLIRVSVLRSECLKGLTQGVYIINGEKVLKKAEK